MRRGLVTILLVIAGCARLAPPTSDHTRPLLDPLLPPASLGRQLARSELVTGDDGDRTYSMRVELEVTPERLVVVGLSRLGMPLFTIEHTSAGIGVQSSVGGEPPFDPAHLLSDLQLVHWPRGVLEEALAARGLRLLERPGEGVRRVLDRDGQMLVEIVHCPASADPDLTTVHHFDRPYRLRIETIAQHAVQ